MADCPICGGRGVVCIDDLCRGAGYCIHGDGDCPNMGIDGICEFDGDDDDDFYPFEEWEDARG